MAYGSKKRRKNKLKSIHDPPDPSPQRLPSDVRAHWGEAYRDAYDVYGKDDLASRAAWREVKLRWKQNGARTWQRCANGVCHWPMPMQLPMPESDLVALGVLVEYVFIDQHGKIQLVQFKRQQPPVLWWDDVRKAVYAFPRNPYPSICRPLPSNPDAKLRHAIDTYERWHQREPECETEVLVPDVTVRAVGAGDSLSYASDKWNDKNPDPRLIAAQEYIHNHWYDVWVWQDTTQGLPHAVMIEGGELDLHERGLIH